MSVICMKFNTTMSSPVFHLIEFKILMKTLTNETFHQLFETFSFFAEWVKNSSKILTFLLIFTCQTYLVIICNFIEDEKKMSEEIIVTWGKSFHMTEKWNIFISLHNNNDNDHFSFIHWWTWNTEIVRGREESLKIVV